MPRLSRMRPVETRFMSSISEKIIREGERVASIVSNLLVVCAAERG